MDDTVEQPSSSPKTVLGMVEAASAGYQSSRVNTAKVQQITNAAERSNEAYANLRRARESTLKMRAAITESTEPGLLESVRKALPKRQESRERAIIPDPVRQVYEQGLNAPVLTVESTPQTSVAGTSAPDNRPLWKRAVDGIKDIVDPSAVAKRERTQKDTADLLKQRLGQYGGNRQQQDPI